MNKIPKNPLYYFVVIVIIYSAYDYYEHISRKDAIFEEHPWYWLFFSSAATTSLILITFFAKKYIEKITKIKNVLIEVTAIGIWLILYLTIIGPLLAKILWPFGTLNFNFRFSSFFIILGIYFITRIIINLITRKGMLDSS
ncbi:hypothetical protein [uncultured Dokdonia sp.]|uniref:hypothetical protein n=1 Tax=uncultured Dokdonia sp. TaxID=575653 RepID=UPI00260DF39A|nr:hypothetical protein [uncultured Dokdonia sp.]